MTTINPSEIDNDKRYLATLRDVIDGTLIRVASTSAHPASSYGLQQWVDRDWVSYGQINMPNVFFELLDVQEVSDDCADSFLHSVVIEISEDEL